MPRATWSGAISFGLVNIPVKLYGAVKDKAVHFHQIDGETGSRVRQKRVSEATGEEIPYDRIVKGYELGGGRYVTVTSDDLEAIGPRGTGTFDLEDFVDLDAIDPMYFDSTYWAVPDGPTAGKAYALLVEAMQRSGRVAIGRFVLRSKQHLAAIRAVDGALAVETMVFPDEVVDQSVFDELPVEAAVSDREVQAAEQLIDSLTTDWEPDRYHDTYREQLLALIDRKAAGEEIMTAPGDDEPAPVIDLMAALEASLKARKEGEAGDRPGRKRPRDASREQSA
jgi:DNA end-binding protein Ku